MCARGEKTVCTIVYCRGARRGQGIASSGHGMQVHPQVEVDQIDVDARAMAVSDHDIFRYRSLK